MDIPQGGGAGAKKAAPAKAAPKAAPGKGAPGEKASLEEQFDEVEEFKWDSELDFSKDLDISLSTVDSETNRTSNPQTIYLRHLELLIKLDLRYA